MIKIDVLIHFLSQGEQGVLLLAEEEPLLAWGARRQDGLVLLFCLELQGEVAVNMFLQPFRELLAVVGRGQRGGVHAPEEHLGVKQQEAFVD